MMQWFVNFSRGHAAPLRILCIPSSGGGANMFRAWASVLDNIEIHSALLPGRERRLMEPAIDTLPQLIEKLIPAVNDLSDKPFLLFGHSMGALIAYELACALRDRNLRRPVHLIVSSYRSPDRANTNRELHGLSDCELIQELRKYGGMPDEILAHEETMAMLLPSLRADFKLHETYRFPSTRLPLDCPITSMAGTGDLVVPPSHMEGWQAKTCARFTQYLFPGAHFYLKDPGTPLIALLQNIINEHLSEASLSAGSVAKFC